MGVVSIAVIKILPFYGVHVAYISEEYSFLFRSRLLLCFWTVLMVNTTFLLYHFRSTMMAMELLMMNKPMIPMITAIALKHKGKS